MPRSVNASLWVVAAVLSLAGAAYRHWYLRANLRVDTKNAECGNKGDKAMIEAKLVSNFCWVLIHRCHVRLVLAKLKCTAARK